jgi:hypothetical protein
MRKFHLKRNPSFCRGVNIDRLWSLMPEEVYEKAKASASSDVAPVIDVTKLVRNDNLSESSSKVRDISKCSEKDSCQKSLLLLRLDSSRRRFVPSLITLFYSCVG